jgi:hypothetical protein
LFRFLLELLVALFFNFLFKRQSLVVDL